MSMWIRLWRGYQRAPWGVDWRGLWGAVVCVLFAFWAGNLWFLAGIAFFLAVGVIAWRASWERRRQLAMSRHPVIRGRAER